jgi:hypothetical protein
VLVHCFGSRGRDLLGEPVGGWNLEAAIHDELRFSFGHVVALPRKGMEEGTSLALGQIDDLLHARVHKQ